jgi:uncharacterized protein YjbI with pentapeptide repeats
METATSLIEWDEQAFERILERLRTEARIDAAGVHIGRDQLARILKAAPADPDRPGWRLLEHANFDGVIFEGDVMFDRTTFHHNASFDGATFGRASFNGATFANGSFYGATFRGYADFRGATFRGHAQFAGATFERADFFAATFEGRPNTWFVGATFRTHTDFQATFKRETWFNGSTFAGGAKFEGARFEGHVSFNGARFERDTPFSGATFDNVSFDGANFEDQREFGPLLAHEVLNLGRAMFAQPIRIEVSARTLFCSRAQFRRGADILARGADVVLDEADFAEPSMLAPRREPIPGEKKELGESHDSPKSVVRVLSVRGAKVAKLTIARADLRACRFEGVHDLDQLRLEGVRFAETPAGWQRTHRWPLPIRWTRRQTIAEEHQWRAERAGATGWWGPEMQVNLGSELIPLGPEEIASAYRALRKGREDSKDEPGAADFYYGEMEMRRQGGGRREARRRLRLSPLREQKQHAPLDSDPRGDANIRSAPTGERLVLWVYWLVSGYGLRASRALVALAVTVVLFAFFFDWWGFSPDRGFGRTLLFSIESTSSLFRVPETPGFALTAAGEVLQVLLRLLGPLFFGLALLSLRGRVKR